MTVYSQKIGNTSEIERQKEINRQLRDYNRLLLHVDSLEDKSAMCDAIILDIREAMYQPKKPDRKWFGRRKRQQRRIETVLHRIEGK